MKKNLNKIIIAGLVFVGVVFFATSYFMEEHEKDVVSGITLAIVEQEKTLATIAEVTDRNGADAVAERIIVDCSLENRVRFDDLLGRLATVNASELDEVDNLFDKCAPFFAERKAVMVSRMEREYEMYQKLVELLSVVDDPIAVAEFNTKGWGDLVAFEVRRSEIFNEQVKIQKAIIQALQEGNLSSSEFIQDEMERARNIAEEVVIVDKQSDTLRAKLLNL